MISLPEVSFLSQGQLEEMFQTTIHNAAFRWFAGRSILDFKLDGPSSFELQPPYEALNPLVGAMVALAERSLSQGERLALVQLIVNLYASGENEVKQHRHRCR